MVESKVTSCRGPDGQNVKDAPMLVTVKGSHSSTWRRLAKSTSCGKQCRQGQSSDSELGRGWQRRTGWNGGLLLTSETAEGKQHRKAGCNGDGGRTTHGDGVRVPCAMCCWDGVLLRSSFCATETGCGCLARVRIQCGAPLTLRARFALLPCLLALCGKTRQLHPSRKASETEVVRIQWRLLRPLPRLD